MNNISKSYRTKNGWHTVLVNLSLQIPDRARVAVIGRNGSGKSTLISLLGGAEYPDRGEILSNCTISWPVGMASGFQGSLTGLDNIVFLSRIHGDTPEKMHERIEFVRDFAEIGEYFEMPVRTFSSGMRSRLAFASSMAFEYDFYLFDEITAVGDQRFVEKCHWIIQEKRKRSGFIMVSHDMNILTTLCDMAIFINEGKVQVYDDVHQAADIYLQVIHEASVH